MGNSPELWHSLYPCPQRAGICAFFSTDASGEWPLINFRGFPFTAEVPCPRTLARADMTQGDVSWASSLLKSFLLLTIALQEPLFLSLFFFATSHKSLKNVSFPLNLLSNFLLILGSIFILLLCELKVILFNSHTYTFPHGGYILVTLQVHSSPFYFSKSRGNPKQNELNN